MKICSCCRKTLTLENFQKKLDGKFGVTAVCKSCLARRVQVYRNENTQTMRQQHIYRTFGLSWETYLQLFSQQRGQCSICKTTLKLHKNDIDNVGEVPHVDHCHTTGKVRGLLCAKCNKALGLFRDNVTIIRLAADYLENSKEK